MSTYSTSSFNAGVHEERKSIKFCGDTNTPTIDNANKQLLEDKLIDEEEVKHLELDEGHLHRLLIRDDEDKSANPKSSKRKSEEEECRQLFTYKLLERRKTVIRQSIVARQSIFPGDQEPHGLLSWLRVLRAISDEDLKLLSGADAALYVIFNRYAAIFFACMTVFNAAVLIPIYATGDPIEHKIIEDPETKQTVTLLVITILNVTGSISKLTASFILILGFYTAATFIFMFFYWKRSLEWRFKDIPQDAKYQDDDIALHTIQVSMIPKSASVPASTEVLRNVFEKMFSKEKVVGARILPKLDQLYEKAQKLKRKK